SQVATALARLPMSFEANRGQLDARVDFLARGHGYALWLTPGEATLALRGQRGEQPHAPAAEQPRRLEPPRPGEAATDPAGLADPAAVLRMKLVGADPAAAAGLDELPGKANYFFGNDPAAWRTNVPTYGRVRYRDVYPGVDLVYYGNGGQLEYDFVVAPGADP